MLTTIAAAVAAPKKIFAECSEAGENSLVSFQQSQFHQSLSNLNFERPEDYFECHNNDNNNNSNNNYSYNNKKQHQHQQQYCVKEEEEEEDDGDCGHDHHGCPTKAFLPVPYQKNQTATTTTTTAAACAAAKKDKKDSSPPSSSHRRQELQPQQQQQQQPKRGSLDLLSTLSPTTKTFAECSEAGENSLVSFQQHQFYNQSLPNLNFESPEDYFECGHNSNNTNTNNKKHPQRIEEEEKEEDDNNNQEKQCHKKKKTAPPPPAPRRNSTSALPRSSSRTKTTNFKTQLTTATFTNATTDKHKKQASPAKTRNQQSNNSTASPRRQRPATVTNQPEEDISTSAPSSPGSSHHRRKLVKKRQQKQVKFSGLANNYDDDMGRWYRREVLLYREQNSLAMSSSARETLDCASQQQLEEIRHCRQHLYLSADENNICNSSSNNQPTNTRRLSDLCQAYEVVVVLGSFLNAKNKNTARNNNHNNNAATTLCLRGLEGVFDAQAMLQVQRQHIQHVLKVQEKLILLQQQQQQQQVHQQQLLLCNNNNVHLPAPEILLRHASLQSSRASREFAIQIALYDTHESLKAILSQW